MLKSWYTESCSSLSIRQTISAGPEWVRSKTSARELLGDNKLISTIQLSTKTCLKFHCGRVFVPPEGNSAAFVIRGEQPRGSPVGKKLPLFCPLAKAISTS